MSLVEIGMGIETEILRERKEERYNKELKEQLPDRFIMERDFL